VIPEEAVAEGLEKRLKLFGKPDDLKHEAISDKGFLLSLSARSPLFLYRAPVFGAENGAKFR
jgi:hypothetical protein